MRFFRSFRLGAAIVLSILGVGLFIMGFPLVLIGIGLIEMAKRIVNEPKYKIF